MVISMKDYKRIPLKGLRNCRDLGGYACADGKMTGYHLLYRSEAPAHLTDTDWNMIQEMGVKTIIDLRPDSEQQMVPYTVPDSIERISYPLQQYDLPAMPSEGIDQTKLAELDKSKLEKMAAMAFGRSLLDGYTKMIEDTPERMVSLLETIEKALDKGAVLYHCTAGKDRTGVLSAIIYLLCGVEDADIIADYQVTATYQTGNPMFDMLPPELRKYLHSAPETMASFLQAAHEKDYITLLKNNGLSDKTIEAIIKKVTV